MSQLDHVDDIAFSTAFLTDKICGIFTGSFAGASTTVLSPGGFMYQFIIPHSFTRPVMCDTLISTDGGASFDPLGAITYSDSSDLYINVLDNTLHYVYKVVCTWIDNYDNTNPLVPAALSSTTGATFDTRYNYQKILQSDVLTLTSANSSVNVPYSNSGNLSNYKVFFESLPGQVWPMINGGSQDPWLNDTAHQWEIDPAVNDTELQIFYSGGASAASSFRAWYRIYWDS